MHGSVSRAKAKQAKAEAKQRQDFDVEAECRLAASTERAKEGQESYQAAMNVTL